MLYLVSSTSGSIVPELEGPCSCVARCLSPSRDDKCMKRSVVPLSMATILPKWFIIGKQIALCIVWGFRCCDYEECRLLGYKNPVRTSQETHYVSTTESSQLMLCNISGFHGGDYEEFRLLGYKNPVRTWEETYYISTTEPSQLMLCKIWSFLLGYKNPVHTSQETHYVLLKIASG
jgi:hypothetical protein